MQKIPVWLKAFIISFVLLFSIGLLLVTWFIQMQKPAAVTQETESSRYQAQPDEVVNVMLLLQKEKEEAPDTILLARIDACHNQVSLLNVPLDLDSTVNTKTKTLKQYAKAGDKTQLKKAVENLFFIEIQRTVQMDDAGLSNCIDYFGGIEWDVPESVVCQEEDGSTLYIERGRQWIDGRRFCALAHDNHLVELFCALGEQQLNEKLAGDIQNYFSLFSKNTVSDFTAYDYTFFKKGITQMLQDHNAKLLLPELKKEEREKRTSITESSREEIQKAFS